MWVVVALLSATAPPRRGPNLDFENLANRDCMQAGDPCEALHDNVNDVSGACEAVRTA
jgi:hypothetical protein